MLSLGGATIPTNGCSVQFRVTGYTTGASFVNSIPANAITNNQGVTNPDPASATLGVQPA